MKISIFFIELSLLIGILKCVFLCCDTIVLEKGEGLVPLKRLKPLQLFVTVLGSDVQWLSSVYVIHKCFSFLVFI